jgi:hypothetical protein
MKAIPEKMNPKKVTKKKEKDVDSIPKNAVAARRELAKAGMVSSLGTLFLTGFLRFKGTRLLHTWAGWALLGFSIWHHILSTSKSKTLSED